MCLSEMSGGIVWGHGDSHSSGCTWPFLFESLVIISENIKIRSMHGHVQSAQLSEDTAIISDLCGLDLQTCVKKEV
jgi:hypothetical protein